MTADIRLRIVERVLGRFDARGVPFERDPQFSSHIEDWIDGTIDMSELRSRYLELLRSRIAERRSGTPPSLVDEPQLVGLHLQGAERGEEAHAEEALLEPAGLGDESPDTAANHRSD